MENSENGIISVSFLILVGYLVCGLRLLNMPRGRPAKVPLGQKLLKILEFSEEIYVNGKVTTDKEVWNRISSCFNGEIKACSLYSNVTNNRNRLLDLIKERLNIYGENRQSDDYCDGNNLDQSDSDSDSSCDGTIYNKKTHHIEFLISPEMFNDMTQLVEYKNTRGGRENKKIYLIFKQGVYQPYFNKQIYSLTKLKCGFNYKRHNLSLDGKTGSITGR